VPHVQTADIYFRRGRVYVTARHLMEPGFWQQGEPAYDLSVDAPAEELGQAVLAALAGSLESMTYDPSDRNRWPPVQRLAKARSWSAFVKGTRHVTVERDAASLRVQAPSDNGDAPDAAGSVPAGTPPSALWQTVQKLSASALPHSGRQPF
jgi:hypothetical protein